MKTRILAALLLSLGVSGAAGAAGDPVVNVTGGAIRGQLIEDGEIGVFKGIPYAAPPVGAQRWRDPAAVKPWKGVREAKAFGASCAQEVQDWDRQEATGNKEDCLYLNIWSPEWSPASAKPVMVWLHGGGNTGGGASVDYFDGASLSRNGVIVVSLNYRLGIFGFFAHPELSAESHHGSGDYGLRDQLAALKWVHDNIARFGGDPENVTLFGQSAGSRDTAMLMASPLAKGLFQRAIQESGAVNEQMPSLADAEQAGTKFAATLKAPAESQIKYLRSLSAEALLKALKTALAAARPNIGPSVDGYVMTANAADIFAAGHELAIPLMIGSNAQEQRGPKPEVLRQTVQEAFGVNGEKALAYYGLNQTGDGNSDPLYGPASQQFWADSRQRCGAVQEADWHASAGNPVFEYQFDHAIAGRPATQHSAEVPYVFGNLLPGGFLGGPYGDFDRRISTTLQVYWTNFAKSGNPNGAGVTAWPKYDPQGHAYLEFSDHGLLPKAALRKDICDLYIDNFRHTLKTAAR